MKKKLIIIGIIVLVIIAGAVGGFFIYNALNKDDGNSKEKFITGEAWGDTYSSSLYSDSSEHDETTTTDGVSTVEKIDYYKDASNITIQLISVREDMKPLMVVEYEQNNSKRCMIYTQHTSTSSDGSSIVYASSINGHLQNDYNEDGTSNEDYDCVLLYNIELGEYRWYLHTTFKSGDESYEDVLNNSNLYLNSDITKEDITNPCYNFKADELKTNQTDEDGNPVISKFEETFIVPEDIDEKKLEANDLHNIDKVKLDEYMKEIVTNYKNNPEVVTEETKTKLENQKTELQDRKTKAQEAADAKAKKEAEEKAAAEEAAKKAAEEAAKGLKVGNYTIKYGTYKAYVDGEGISTGETLTINSDGTYTMKYGSSNGYKTVTGTYEVTQVDMSQADAPLYKTGIKFSSAVSSLIATSSTELHDCDIMIYKYSGQ